MESPYKMLQNMYGSGGTTVEQTPNGIVVRNNTRVIYEERFIATLVNAGPPSAPNNTTDFTDERYWAIAVYPFVTSIAQPMPALQLADSTISPSAFWWGPATNLSEAFSHTHLLRVGKPSVLAGSVVSSKMKLGEVVTIQCIRVFDNKNFMGQGYYFTSPVSGTFKYRITGVSGSFPVWSYTCQRVIYRNTGLTDQTQWVTDGINVAGVSNRCEWTPGSYPFIHGTGVMVENSSGAVSTTYSGGTAGNCKIRAIGVGSVVDLDIDTDQNYAPNYSFYVPNSAQAD